MVKMSEKNILGWMLILLAFTSIISGSYNVLYGSPNFVARWIEGGWSIFAGIILLYLRLRLQKVI